MGMIHGEMEIVMVNPQDEHNGLLRYTLFVQNRRLLNWL